MSFAVTLYLTLHMLSEYLGFHEAYQLSCKEALNKSIYLLLEHVSKTKEDRYLQCLMTDVTELTLPKTIKLTFFDLLMICVLFMCSL